MNPTTPTNLAARHRDCPVCGFDQSTDFFHASDVPVTCASIFETRDEAAAVPTGDIDLTMCGVCSFVFNRSFDSALGEIGARYESSQAASGHFGAFAQALAADWIDRYALTGRTVLEVGSGGGDFLRRLLQNGVARAIGIDPFASCAASDDIDPARLTLITEPFSERHVHLAADALVCRHTLEHVQNVKEFLALLQNWASRGTGRVVMFELPAAERVFAEHAFWDIYYEHCNYFTETTLRRAFEVVGFEVLRISQVYEKQYLIVEARAKTAQTAQQPRNNPDVGTVLSAYRAYGHSVNATIVNCQRELERLRAEGPLLLWQGAAKTVGFLAMLPNAAVVDAAIDLSPQRQGRFLPGSGLPVYAPSELPRLRPRNIVLMNPVYLTEVRNQVRDLGLDVPVHAINDLLEPHTTTR